MFISKLVIEGYKNCKNESSIEFQEGLNILVGENASGKTTIINALRMILKEREYSYLNIEENDFYRSFEDDYLSDKIKIDLYLSNLDPDEEVTFYSWCDADFNAVLHLDVNNKINRKGYYKKVIWGGASKASIFEEETFDSINCVYLPPLRDAEEKLTNGKKSRLATLLKHQFASEEDETTFVGKVRTFNQTIVDNKDGEFKEIAKAKFDINNSLQESMGTVFGQSINLQFADVTFNTILQSIRMVFFPQLGETNIEKFRDIAINSLGFNNLLYIATVFSELQAVGKDNNLFTILLIEEPEAHLHPQLQVKLIKYLETLTKSNKNMQIILTSHSPVLASSVSIDSVIHIYEKAGFINATQLSKLNMGQSKNFVNRWLDVTKSTLLFSKGVIFVEGISESLTISEIAKYSLEKYNRNKLGKKLLPNTLEEAGVSVINISGINFKHFFKMFCNIDESESVIKLPMRCSGITDNDPEKIKEILQDKNGKDIEKKVEYYPELNSKPKGNNSALDLIQTVNISGNTRLFASPLKTFEYDMAMMPNTNIMAEVLYNIWPTKGSVKTKLLEIANKKNIYANNDELREDAIFVFKHIEDDTVGKGVFAQYFADILSKSWIERQLKNKSEELSINIPEYIYKAIIWACGGDISE
ncbi:AAA family ATPase [Clostridia bacterium]|nr:AAA family ATPase [Clostridia bacterium]